MSDYRDYRDYDDPTPDPAPNVGCLACPLVGALLAGFALLCHLIKEAR